MKKLIASLAAVLIALATGTAGSSSSPVFQKNLGKRLAIVIAGRAYCAPKIMTEISGGKAQITGNFSEQEAKDLAARINETVTKN